MDRITWILVDDRRARVTDVAALVGVSKSTVTNRIQNLRRAEVLREIHADSYWEAFGLPPGLWSSCVCALLDQGIHPVTPTHLIPGVPKRIHAEASCGRTAST